MGFAAEVSLLKREAVPPRNGTCAALLQAAQLLVQPLQGVGVFSLQEQQVLLGTLQLVLQG